MKELGETLDAGEAALIVIGESKVGEQDFEHDLEEAGEELAQAGRRNPRALASSSPSSRRSSKPRRRRNSP
jgi:hypothetical protein